MFQRRKPAAPTLLRLEPLEARVAPARVIWSGDGGPDTRLSNGANWVGGVAPIQDDSLVFPALNITQLPVNDFVGTEFNSLQFEGWGYLLSGNVLGLHDLIDTSPGGS